MNEYEILLDEVVNEIPVIETELKINTGLKGSYRNKTIFLDKYLNTVEKRVLLSEEYSHHRTSIGNIIDYTKPDNRKQEWKARRDSVERLVTLDQLIDCSYFRCHTKFECAEFLGITEQILKKFSLIIMLNTVQSISIKIIFLFLVIIQSIVYMLKR